MLLWMLGSFKRSTNGAAFPILNFTSLIALMSVVDTGAKEQIKGKLKDRGYDKKEANPAGAYAAKVGSPNP